MTPRTILASIALSSLLAACGSDGTSLDSGRTLGILQMSTGGAEALSAQGGGDGSNGDSGVTDGGDDPGGVGGSGPDSPISWDVPPGSGDLFPPEVVRVPGSVVAGSPFSVTVFTVGPNGCWSPDGIDVTADSGIVDLTPWDRHSGGEVCTEIFGYLGHEAMLTLAEAGEWTLRVEGRRIRGDGALDGSVRAERKIQVFPDFSVPAPVEIELSPGDGVVVEGVLRLAFTGVENDSRCPGDVQCVWQGNAEVHLWTERGEGPRVTTVLNTGVEPMSTEVNGYRILLLGLTPAPISTSTIPAGTYRALLRIEPVP